MITKETTGAAKVSQRHSLTPGALRRQSSDLRGRGGVSEENRSLGFAPAFLDMETGSVYLARFADGRPAPMHLLDGLPEEAIISRKASGAVSTVKATIIAGFLRYGRFFTREEAAQACGYAWTVPDHSGMPRIRGRGMIRSTGKPHTPTPRWRAMRSRA